MCTLPALHCFTGNDYTSAIYGIGKNRAFKAIQRNEDFINLFKSFGDTFLFNSELFPMVEKLSARKNVNEGRYLKFYGKKKTPEPQQLPPTGNAFLCHCKCVSYAMAIIKQSLVNNPVIPSLGKEFGWSIDNDSLEIQCLLVPPAPDNVLNLINCSCEKEYKTNACTCKLNGLECTELCQCTDKCENGKSVEEEIEEQDVEDDRYLTDGEFVDDDQES